ncbi:hypothetical protein HMPREF0971_02896, partial [Segatella oris F0302]
NGPSCLGQEAGGGRPDFLLRNNNKEQYPKSGICQYSTTRFP